CSIHHHELAHEPYHVRLDPEEQELRRKDGSARPNHIETMYDEVFKPLQINHTAQLMNPQINCQVVPVNLVSKSVQKQVYAFLDIGSEYTIMDQALAEELGLEGEEAPLAYKTIDGAGTVSSKQVSVEIQNVSNKKCYMLEGVYTFPNLDLYGGTVRQTELNKWKHLAKLK